jgi:hypothetical protein
LKKIFSILLLGAFALGFTGCASELTNQKMYWKATNDAKDFNLGNLAKHKFKVEKFQDARKTDPRNKIAENTENPTPKIVTIDTNDVGPFVTTNVAQVLSRAGLEVVENGQDYVITGTIKDLFSDESNIYKGTATIKYEVKKGDKVVWSDVKSGSSKRFGRSYKMENYMESISDAIVDSLMKFLNDSEMKAALK